MTGLSRFLKLKAPKGVWRSGLLILLAIQQAIGGRILLVCQGQACEFGNEIVRSEYAVSVEMSACLSLRRHSHIQRSSWPQYASQFFTGEVSSLSVKGITVTTQTDMLHHGETGKRFDRIRVERKVGQSPCTKAHTRQVDRKLTN